VERCTDKRDAGAGAKMRAGAVAGAEVQIMLRGSELQRCPEFVEDAGEEEEFDSDNGSSGNDNTINNMDESAAHEEEEEQEGEMESSNILQRDWDRGTSGGQPEKS
jgi:hypothetical protein